MIVTVTLRTAQGAPKTLHGLCTIVCLTIIRTLTNISDRLTVPYREAPMIVTVTLTASIDNAYQLTRPLEVHEVQRVATVIDRAGGKGLNCARAVKTCGEDVVATGFVGGHNGELLCDLLQADGVEQDFCVVEAETRCCINALDPDGASTEFLEPGRPVGDRALEAILDKVEALAKRADGVTLNGSAPALDPDGASTEFLEPGRPVGDRALEAILDKVEALAKRADGVTLNGSAPAGLPKDVYALLIERVKKAGAKVLLDTSGELLLEGVRACPTMVKPNTDEIAAVLGHAVTGEEEVVAAAKELHEQGVPLVVVSLGGAGAVMACDEGVYRGRSPRIEVVNPVGSGDTLVGAFGVALARGASAPEALRYGMACATANCLSPETGAFDLTVAEELQAQTAVERIG